MSDDDDSHTPRRRPKSITIRLTKKNVIIIFLSFALVLSIFTGGFGYGTDSEGVVINQAGGGTVAQPSAPQRVTVSTDDDAVKGDDDAPITIIEFSDFECPYCGRFYEQTLPSLIENYIDTGKAKLIFRDLPLPFHSTAQVAAEAAECVRSLGGDEAYYDMHDIIFERQPSLSESSLISWADELGFDIQSCLDDGTFTTEVNADYRDAQASGASGTPTFFIGNEENGYVKLVGAQPFAAFKSIIDAELA